MGYSAMDVGRNLDGFHDSSRYFFFFLIKVSWTQNLLRRNHAAVVPEKRLVNLTPAREAGSLTIERNANYRLP